MEGTVYKSTGSWYTVKTVTGHAYECRIRGKWRMDDIQYTNPVAVGDVVGFEPEDSRDGKKGVITRVHDRKNYLVRRSVKLSRQKHIIAANIDRAFLLVTLENPVTHPVFIDRFLSTAEAYDIEAVLLFNKDDLFGAELEENVRKMMALYEKIGYKCLVISALEGHNTGAVKELMKGKVNMFAGHSGVGKSTLANTLEPGLDLKTSEISDQHRQGRHTTTFAEMFDLSFGARLIDTPGIRGFGLVDMDKDEAGDYFPEIFKLKEQCKFNNCLHQNEPGCAVKKAVEDGTVSQSRYHSYLRIIDGEGEIYR